MNVLVLFCSFFSTVCDSAPDAQNSPSLVGPVKDPEKILRGQVAAPRPMPSVKATDDIRPTGQEKCTRSVSELMTALLKSAGKKYDSQLSRSSSKGASSFRGSDGYPRPDVYTIVEALL